MKHRFDGTGKGRGSIARHEVTSCSDLSTFTRNEDLSGGFRKKRGTKKGKRSSPTSRTRKGGGKDGSAKLVRRLTDTGNYTGTHKHRFDKSGKGRGLAGRDSIAKGSSRVDAHGVADYYVHPIYPTDNVHDLSVIMRPGRSKAQSGSKSSRAKKGFSSPARKKRNSNPSESIEHPNDIGQVERELTASSIFSRLTDESSFTGTHRTRPAQRKHNLSDEGDDLPKSDASSLGADALHPDQLEPGLWDTSISNDSINDSTGKGRYLREVEADRGDVGSPTSPQAIVRAEKAASRRAQHERKKAERRSARGAADIVAPDDVFEIDLDATETHGDDCVGLLVTVRQQQTGMAALTKAILKQIEEEQSAASQPLFDVKTDYTKQQKSVCIRIGTHGIDFLDSRATMDSLAVLPFSSLEAWSLVKPGRLALKLQGSEKSVTIVSKQATTIIQALTTWAPIAGTSGDGIATTETTQGAAGATITFSRRFGSEFLAEDAANSSPLSVQHK